MRVSTVWTSFKLLWLLRNYKKIKIKKISDTSQIVIGAGSQCFAFWAGIQRNIGCLSFPTPIWTFSEKLRNFGWTVAGRSSLRQELPMELLPRQGVSMVSSCLGNGSIGSSCPLQNHLRNIEILWMNWMMNEWMMKWKQKWEKKSPEFFGIVEYGVVNEFETLYAKWTKSRAGRKIWSIEKITGSKGHTMLCWIPTQKCFLVPYWTYSTLYGLDLAWNYE